MFQTPHQQSASQQSIEPDQVITIGPFIFQQADEWKDLQIEAQFQQTCWKSVQSPKPRLTNNQIHHFSKKYGKYKKQPSKLILTNGKFHTFFPQDLVDFLISKRGKYSVQTMEDADFSHNVSTDAMNYYNSQQKVQLFKTQVLCLLDFCNLAVLKLRGNRISSLEWVVLACNKFQSLLELDLQSNEIVSLKSFNKGKFSQLRLLKLEINYLKDIDFIQRCLIYGLECLKLDYNLMSDWMALYKCSFHLMDSLGLSHNVLRDNEDNRMRLNVLGRKFIKLKHK